MNRHRFQSHRLRIDFLRIKVTGTGSRIVHLWHVQQMGHRLGVSRIYSDTVVFHLHRHYPFPRSQSLLSRMKRVDLWRFSFFVSRKDEVGKRGPRRHGFCGSNLSGLVPDPLDPRHTENFVHLGPWCTGTPNNFRVVPPLIPLQPPLSPVDYPSVSLNPFPSTPKSR